MFKEFVRRCVVPALGAVCVVVPPAIGQTAQGASALAPAGAIPQVEISVRAVPQYPPVQPLITVSKLRDLMAEQPVHIVDIRNPKAIRPMYSYSAGHIPGAINVPYGTWRAAWSDPLNVPQDDDLTRLVQAAGLTKDRPVIIVHSSAAKGNFGSAAWVYWLLKSSGFTNMAILDGGIRSWKRAGGEISKAPSQITPSAEVITLDRTWLATHEDVDAVIAGTSKAQLLDARPLHQIAKQSSLPRSFTLNSEELMLGEHGEAGDIVSIFERLKFATVDWEYSDIITYCNNGSLAAIDWFMASEVAGIANVRIYGHSLNARDKALRVN